MNTSICSLLFLGLSVGAFLAQAQTCPDSCSDLLTMDPNAGDGQYTIASGGNTFSVYCNDMAGTPAEYLSLANTGGNFNFGQYTAGGAAPGTDVRTNYTRVRIDPATLIVSANDTTFSSSTGSLTQGSVITSTNYGRASDCSTLGSATGLTNVDLRGLPFEVTDTWTVSGFNPGGSSVFSSANQVVDATGGGFCGWNSPGAAISLGFNDALAPAPAACIEADIGVTLDDGFTSAIPGQQLTYTLVATNNGPNGAGAVSLGDTFPADLNCTWTSIAAGGATGNTAAGSGNLSETLIMPAASSATYTVSCTIDSGATGTLSNTATASSPVEDLTPGNNSASDSDTLLIPTTDLSITVTDGVSSAVPGGAVTYTIVASNIGPSDAPSVSLSDNFPAPLSCSYTSVAAAGATGNTSGSGNLTEALSMPAGSSVTYTTTCTIDSGATGTLSNVATISSAAIDPTSGNDTASDTDTLLSAQADLGITITDGLSAATPGEPLIYTIVASNLGLSDVAAATLTDTFAASLSCTHTSVATGGASGNTAGSGNLAETISMPSGSSITYTVTCDIDPDASGTLSNTAAITSHASDLVLGNNSATDNDTALVPDADLSVTLAGRLSVNNEQVNYTVVLQNHGPSSASGAVVTTELSAALLFDSSADGCTATGQQVSCPVATLAVGNSATLTLTAQVLNQDQLLSSTSTASANEADSAPGNNSSALVLRVASPVPALGVAGALLLVMLLAASGLFHERRRVTL